MTKNGRTILLEKEEKMRINSAVEKAKIWESECEEQILILSGLGRNTLG